LRKSYARTLRPWRDKGKQYWQIIRGGNEGWDLDRFTKFLKNISCCFKSHSLL
jgi:hypothetical protein